MDSYSIIPKTECAHSGLFCSQKDSILYIYQIVAVIADEETKNKPSSTLNVSAPDGSHDSETEVFDESNYRDSILPENIWESIDDNQHLVQF
ncbi:unnamed protein product [Schistosoma mattheei]|uniref:Uncharacterized protein n=1 Tax=Schistosoma mattheei TaxID=31246 RepID=A0A183Q1U5_9TREM|nr:unnamed protein product [Schistosoma mattheei]